MDSRWLYAGFLAVVAVSRLAELVLSRRNQRRLAEAGARRKPDPVYPLMVALHSLTLVGAALEVFVFQRPLVVWLAASCFLVWLLANALRFWCIRTLGRHWNTQVVDSTSTGVISSGPYRWVRHPNYTAVFVEMLAIPLLHTAWITALVVAVAHSLVLRARVRSEESVLSASEEWRRAMAHKPRFIPRFRV